MFMKLLENSYFKDYFYGIKNFFCKNFILLIIVILCGWNFLLQKGYFLSVDWIYGPKIKLVPTQYYPNQAIWIYLQKFLNIFFPAWILQKIIFISLFFVSYLAAKKFASFFTTKKIIKELAALFYIFNPFFYSRVIHGQWFLVLAFGLMPLFCYYLVKYFRKINKKDLLILSFLAAVIFSLSPHHGFFIAVIFLVFVLGNLSKIKISHLLCFLIIIFCANSYWLFLVKKETNLSNFSIYDLVSFNGTNFATRNYYLDVLSMHGFWGEAQNRFIPIYNINKNWWIGSLIMLAFVLIGVLYSYRVERSLSLIMIGIAGSSYIMALGCFNNIFSGFNSFLSRNIPFYIGMRDANKWVGILIIAYLYFFIFFLKYVSEKIFFENNYFVCKVFLVSFIVASQITLLFSFRGALSAVNYPRSWYYAKDFLDSVTDNSNSNNRYCSIAFPWHQSIGFSFTGKIIANPSGIFFDNKKCRMLFGDNMEIGSIYSQSTRKESQVIEKYIGASGIFKEEEDGITRSGLEGFLSDLKRMGIKNIILMEEADYLWYKFFLGKMVESAMIKEGFRDDGIIIYEIY